MSEHYGGREPGEREGLERWFNEREEAPADASEQYYQVAPEVLDCFPALRIPLDLFRLDERARSMQRVYEAGDRLEPENRSRLDEACCKGLLFVSRGQRHIYSKYIIHQLELILLDDNLHSWESASILHEAFADRLARFQEESSGKNLERIRRGAEILAQYLLDDRRRILDLVRVAHERLEAEYEDVLTALIGLALYLEQYGSSLRSGDLERTGLGLFLLDVGMARLPRFITHKAGNPDARDMKRLRQHPWLGVDLLERLGMDDDRILTMVGQHHERLDGSGFPGRLSGGDVSGSARLAAVASAYAAMITAGTGAGRMGERGGMRPAEAARMLLSRSREFDQRHARSLVAVLQRLAD